MDTGGDWEQVSMDIDEARDKKAELETLISRLLDDFARDTGLKVSGVDTVPIMVPETAISVISPIYRQRNAGWVVRIKVDF